MRDLVEAGFDVALHHPLVGVGRGSAPRPPRHAPGGWAETVARHGEKSASKIGSNTSFRDAWTTRSVTVAIPDGAACHPAWGSSAPAPATGGTSVLQRGPQPVEERLDPLPGLNGAGGRRPPRASGRPFVPRTRSHATKRNAGSRRGCTDHRTCDEDHHRPTGAAWPGSPVPGAPPVQGRLQLVGIHRRDSWLPTSARSTLLAPFPMCAGSPRPPGGRTPRPPPHPRPSAGDAPALPARWIPAGPGDRSGSHVHRVSIDEVGAQLSPAASPRLRRSPSAWPPHRRLSSRLGVAPRPGRVTHCNPAHIRQI